MQITPPFGYGEIVPLEKHHRVLLPASGNAGTVPDFAKRVNAMAISFSEFAIAQRDYPIVFATADSGQTYAPVAVLGLADCQNLFIDEHERWAEGAYVPAFVRRYPFCISRIFNDGVAQDERLVCVEKSYVDASGIAMFNAAGLASDAWAERERLLAEYEKDLDLTAQMCSHFASLGLFAPFTMQVKNGDTAGLTMQGMHCIDEAKFAAQDAAEHRTLAVKGLAARLYAHLFSLGNFSRLVDRALAQDARRRASRRA